MKASIITATYNSSETIKNCIDSINSQCYDNYEHIVIDNLSKDNTIDIILKISRKRPIIISEKDNGIYEALNKGVKKASGDIIIFLHSDDSFVSSTCLKKICECFHQKENISALYGNVKYLKNGETWRIWKSKGNYDAMKYGWMPPHPSFIAKKSLYLDIGYFNTIYSISADYDFLIRVFKSESRFNIKYIDEFIIEMKSGGKSNKGYKNLLTKWREDFQIINHHNLNGVTTLILKNIRKVPQFFSSIK